MPRHLTNNSAVHILVRHATHDFVAVAEMRRAYKWSRWLGPAKHSVTDRWEIFGQWSQTFTHPQGARNKTSFLIPFGLCVRYDGVWGFGMSAYFVITEGELYIYIQCFTCITNGISCAEFAWIFLFDCCRLYWEVTSVFFRINTIIHEKN